MLFGLFAVKVGVVTDVSVGVDVLVGVGVKVGPNNCPGPQAERNKWVITIMIIAVWRFIVQGLL